MILFKKTTLLVLLMLLIIACSTQGIHPTGSKNKGEFAGIVIGVSYQSAKNKDLHLLNTVNDAKLIANYISQLQPQFSSVQLVLNPNKIELSSELNAFAKSMNKETTAVLYYAGHGVQINSENYLLAEDMDGMVRVTDIIKLLRLHSKGVIIILDACRNNPFISQGVENSDNSQRQLISLQTSSLTREIQPLLTVPLKNLENGLARMQVTGSRILIVFSTDPGDVAADEAYPNAKNSPFTQALAENITKKKSFEDILSDVASQMEQISKQSQIKPQTPWRQSSWTEPLYFSGKPNRFNTGAKRGIPPP